ncbi:MAG: serine/threonine-protein kinase [Planctomycetaceae bacterium]
MASSSALDVPARLGGYRILRLLGRGAMGAVYEAKQISLDRNVALKTIRGRLAGNPSALARFTREAYAAAQLVHHNVVQIYDFGQDAGQHYFSMEWVRGGPLSDLIRDHGPVAPRVAATYALQAARGLQFAHRHGMVHRDVKPANLLLNDEGVVKVADLGLVKVPDQPDSEWEVDAVSAGSGLASGTQVTMMGTAVGTPAYMAPEQSIDATTVDHRADIYSLGCTLFYLLAGKAPFDGSQVSEVMRQHAQSPVPKIRSINPQVPEPLSGIIERSMAKRPEDRYASLADMIAALENYLGLQPEQGFSPSHQQADRWEELAAAFAAVPLAKLTRPAILGLVAFAMLLLLVTPLLGMRWLLTGPALLFTAFAVAWGLSGSGGRSIVATRLRHWLGSLSWFDYAVGLVVSLMTLFVSFLLGMIPGLVIGVVLGAAAGAGYHFLLALPLRQARNPIAADAEKFVRDLRITGIDEENIRDFAARYSGTAWRPLFEELFGYDAMLAMRAKLASDPAATSNAGGRTLRDWICASLQAKTDANRMARDHQRLATLEEQGLKSEGMTAAEAKERAWQMASAMMDAAKLQPLPLAVANDPKVEADQRRTRMKTMLAEARSGKYAKQRDRLAPLRLLLGGKVRLLIGCGLLAWFGLWAYRNDVFTAESLRQMSEIRDIDELRNQVQQQIATATENTDLPKLLGTSGWAVGIAGLLMAGSSFISGWRMSLFAVPAVIVAIFGESFGIPAVAGIPAWAIASAIALVLMIPGVLWGESRRADY